MIFFNKKDKEKTDEKPSEASEANSADKKASSVDKPEKENLPDSERIAQGQILATIIIEMVGKPEKHLTTTLNKYVEEIKGKPVFSVVKTDIAEPQEVEDSDMFSMFVEIEMWFQNMNPLIAFCFDYMPSSIDIIKPEQITYSSKDFSGFLNDLQANLHNMDMIVKTLKEQANNLNRNSAGLLKNLVLVTLNKKAMSAEEIAKRVGVDVKHMESFLKKYVEEGLVKKDGDNYSLPK